MQFFSGGKSEAGCSAVRSRVASAGGFVEQARGCQKRENVSWTLSSSLPSRVVVIWVASGSVGRQYKTKQDEVGI